MKDFGQLTLKVSLPKNNFVEIDECGHLLTLERPEAVTSLIQLWLDCQTEKAA